MDDLHNVEAAGMEETDLGHMQENVFQGAYLFMDVTE